MSVQLTPVGVTADCTIRVPLSAPGTLADGVERVLSRVESVETVRDVAVTGVTPGMNDITVDVTVECTVATETARESAVAAGEALGEGTGVAAVEVVDVDDAGPPDRRTVG